MEIIYNWTNTDNLFYKTAPILHFINSNIDFYIPDYTNLVQITKTDNINNSSNITLAYSINSEYQMRDIPNDTTYKIKWLKKAKYLTVIGNYLNTFTVDNIEYKRLMSNIRG